MAKDVAGLPEPFGGQTGEQIRRKSRSNRTERRTRSGRSIGTTTMIRSGMWRAMNWRRLGAKYSLMAYSPAKTAQIR